MSDITTDTKRFVDMTDNFRGASTNDLVRIAAQAIDYAGEISLEHSQRSTGRWIDADSEKINNDHETTMANVIRDIRDNDITVMSDDLFQFEYDGMTFEVMTEQAYVERCESMTDCMVEDAIHEFENQFPVCGHLNAYIKFDEEMFRRDLQYDIEGWIAPYDGTVYEMFWNEYTSTTGNPFDSKYCTRRGTLYMIRED